MRYIQAMKIRNPGLIKLAGFLAANTVRGLMRSVRTREFLPDPTIRPSHPRNRQRYLYAFWHDALFYLAGRYGDQRNIAILISRHADGEMIAQACRWLGIRTVRGSTAKSGAAALLQMLDRAHHGHLAITPDGPRGPRHEVQLGTIYLASKTGFPIVPIGVAYRRAWYARNWDRMGVPIPFSRAAGIAAEPLHVPPGVPKEELHGYAVELKRRMLDATAQAQEWVRRRKW
jgi:lysophospholipid acyltransferase (LPLAT)-like uncharacterized protein